MYALALLHVQTNTEDTLGEEGPEGNPETGSLYSVKGNRKVKNKMIECNNSY